MALIHCHMLGIATAGQESADRVSLSPSSHLCAGRLDHSCDLKSRNVRCRTGWGGVATLALNQVGPIYARCFYPNQDVGFAAKQVEVAPRF